MASDTNTNANENGNNGAKRGRKPGQTVVSKDFAFMLKMADFDFASYLRDSDFGTMAWHMRITKDMLAVLRDDTDNNAIF